MTVVNNENIIFDIARSYQLENGESQDLCGMWAVASLSYAGLPGKGARGTAENIDQWADNEANKYMPNGAIQWLGSSIGDMYDFMTDSVDITSKQRNIHWWDMSPISTQNIRIAVKAGYPVLATMNEQNIIEKKTGKMPYPWRLNTNHILPIVGIDSDGDYICADQLNNEFQGYWPPVYLATRANPSWASIIQIVGPDPHNSWLATIPSSDPSQWPEQFNAQNFAKLALTARQQQMIDIWNSTQHLFSTSIDLFNDGIGQDWYNKYQAKYDIGAPISRCNSVDWNGNHIILAYFTNGMCQDMGGKHRWWYNGQEVTF